MSQAYLDCGIEVSIGPKDETGAEQRQKGRLEVEGVTTSVRQATFTKPGPMRVARVLDIGTGGISFESTSTMPIGQKVELVIDTPARNGIAAVGRVKYCIRWASGFRVGIEFVEINPTDQKFFTKEYFNSP